MPKKMWRGYQSPDDGVPASTTPVVSSDTFLVKTAYINYFNDPPQLPVHGQRHGQRIQCDRLRHRDAIPCHQRPV